MVRQRCSYMLLIAHLTILHGLILDNPLEERHFGGSPGSLRSGPTPVQLLASQA